MKKILVILCSIISISVSQIQSYGVAPGEFTQDYEAAREYAEENNLPLLLNFTGSDWCGWCTHMDRSVFSETAWQQYASENVVLVAFDFPSDPNRVPSEYVSRNNTISNQYGVEGYPTYILIDAEENEIARLGASQQINPQMFIGQVEQALGRAQPSTPTRTASGKRRK